MGGAATREGLNGQTERCLFQKMVEDDTFQRRTVNQETYDENQMKGDAITQIRNLPQSVKRAGGSG